MNQSVTTQSERRSHAASLGVLCCALAVMSGACANSGTTTTTPSGVAPTSQNAASVKSLTVAFSPTTLTVGANAITVTITNTGSGSAAGLGSVQITLPAGLIPVSTANFSGATSWFTQSIAGQVVTVGATIGTQKLDPGQSVTFTLNVSASQCGPLTVAAPIGSNETPGTFAPSGWSNTAGDIHLTVNGCTIDCPAAPAVSNAYLDSIQYTGGRGTINNAVAKHMTQGALFDGITPCDLAAYQAAVVAFIHTNFGI